MRSTLVRSHRRYPRPLVSPEQVAARSAPRYQAQAPVPANPLANLVQQLESNLRTLFNSGGYWSEGRHHVDQLSTDTYRAVTKSIFRRSTYEGAESSSSSFFVSRR
jgi:hypothetical protein